MKNTRNLFKGMIINLKHSEKGLDDVLKEYYDKNENHIYGDTSVFSNGFARIN